MAQNAGKISGQIPEYGDHFRQEMRRDFANYLARITYVSKKNTDWFIRSDGNCEKWWIFNVNMESAIAGPFDTMGETMARLVYALWELYAGDTEPRPNL